MGLYNRDYLNADTDHRPAPPRSAVTWILVITIGVYLLQLATANNDHSPVKEALALDAIFQNGQIWRLVTYAFLHDEVHLGHIVCNMVAFFFLGRVVCRTIGDREFVWLYLSAAVFSGIVQSATIVLFEEQPKIVLGASGAVSAIFILFTLHYPRVKLFLFGIIPVQARWLLYAVLAWDTLGFLNLVPSIFLPADAGIGHAAHLGGLLFGLLYFRWEMNLSGGWDRLAGGRKEASEPEVPALKVFAPGHQPEPHLSLRLDDILAKISRDGEASLTARERRFLSLASQQLNKSR